MPIALLLKKHFYHNYVPNYITLMKNEQISLRCLWLFCYHQLNKSGHMMIVSNEHSDHEAAHSLKINPKRKGIKLYKKKKKKERYGDGYQHSVWADYA